VKGQLLSLSRGRDIPFRRRREHRTLTEETRERKATRISAARSISALFRDLHLRETSDSTLSVRMNSVLLVFDLLVLISCVYLSKSPIFGASLMFTLYEFYGKSDAAPRF